MTTTAHEDQFTAATQTIEPVRQLYDTAAILRRDVADLEVALKQQTDRAEAAEAELLAIREDNHAMMLEIDGLSTERDRQRNDADVGSAIQRAAAELPRGYILGISIEADTATVDLCLPTGHIKHMDVDDENRLAAEINAAIGAAKRRCEACAILPCSCK